MNRTSISSFLILLQNNKIFFPPETNQNLQLSIENTIIAIMKDADSNLDSDHVFIEYCESIVETYPPPARCHHSNRRCLDPDELVYPL